MDSVEVIRICDPLQTCADQLSLLLNKHQKPLHKTATKAWDSPGTLHSKDEIMDKFRTEGEFLQDLINVLIFELRHNKSSEKLFTVVMEEKSKKAKHLEMIKRNKELEFMVKELQNQLAQISLDKNEECERFKDLVVHLEYQKQALMALVDEQEKISTSSAEQLVFQQLQMNSFNEQKQEEEIQTLMMKIEEESKVNNILQASIANQHQDLKDKLDFFIEKFHRDLKNKEREISVLQRKRAEALARNQALSNMYRDMHRVIIEDRTMMENIREKREEEKRKLVKIVQIQAAWRGTVVRKALRAAKKPAGKKGKK